MIPKSGNRFSGENMLEQMFRAGSSRSKIDATTAEEAA